MMGEILTLVGVALWVAVLIVWAWSIYRKRRNGAFFTEHALVIGSLLLLAIAPCVLLMIHVAGGVPSIGHISIHLLGAMLLLAAAFQSRRRRLDPELDGSPQSYREKSAVLVVLGQILVFSAYFYANWSATLEQLIPAFIGALVLLVIIMVIGHIVIAVFHYPIDEIDEPIDQMASQIEALGNRNGNLIIVAGFWTVPFLALSPAPAPLVLNCWLAFLVLSAVVKYGSVIAYSRLGIS
jgi:hypothetical protein